ncbi:helix-turn-helix domain-containing protein [Candidatus Saccharibacteria bacterium]|nr:helix-turn-helix domain-containing protein [Candidatus Saccharibacteria bacterium]
MVDLLELNSNPTILFEFVKKVKSTPNDNTDSDDAKYPYAKEKVIRSITQHQKRLSKLEIRTICERYQNGASIYKLAADFGCHRRTISDTLKRNGVEVSHQATKKPELVKKIIELYAEMKTPKEVGAIVGVNGDTVRKVLKENGIYIRKSWEYPKK